MRGAVLHANKGKQWEGLVASLLYELTRHGHGYWYRIPEPVRQLSRIERGTFRAVYESQAQPDFGGIYKGRAVLLDAKDSGKARMPLASIPPQQAEALQGCAEAGGLSLVALRLQGDPWLLPWEDGIADRWFRWNATRARAARGTASISAEDCAAIGGLRFGVQGRGLLDALDGLV